MKKQILTCLLVFILGGCTAEDRQKISAKLEELGLNNPKSQTSSSRSENSNSYSEVEVDLNKLSIVDRFENVGIPGYPNASLYGACDNRLGNLYSGNAIALAVDNGEVIKPVKDMQLDCVSYMFLYEKNKQKALKVIQGLYQ